MNQPIMNFTNIWYGDKCPSCCAKSFVCGTDNKIYYHIDYLECYKITPYGKSINLQLKHKGACWIWETYGYETSTVLWVSKSRN